MPTTSRPTALPARQDTCDSCYRTRSCAWHLVDESAEMMLCFPCVKSFAGETTITRIRPDAS